MKLSPPLSSLLSQVVESVSGARDDAAARAPLDPVFGVRTVRGAASLEAVRGTTSSYSGAALIAPPPPPPKASEHARRAQHTALRVGGFQQEPRAAPVALRHALAAAPPPPPPAAAAGPKPAGASSHFHRDHPGEGRERGERRARAPPAQRTAACAGKPTAGDARLAGRDVVHMRRAALSELVLG